ncbi:MAG: retropepsin-like domain-containing protein [Candidatus Eremiobacteraeota bacterium]|nr:retropepsin-like domain-containing protein [Candidatus Eremiobacteraeota bacterium]
MAMLRAFAAGALLFCAALLPVRLAAAPARGGPAFEQLLDRMRAVNGPVWDTHFISISRLEFNGSATVVSTEGLGVAFVLRRCDGEVCAGTYFDGERLYTVDMNDTALLESPQTEPYLRALRTIASLTFLSPAFEPGGGRLTDGGTQTLYGKRYATMIMSDPKAVSLRIFVDPQTALVRYVRDIAAVDTFEYRDYRRVEGYTLPYEITHNGTVLEHYDDRTPVGTAFDAPHGFRAAFSGAPRAIATDPAYVTPIFECTLGGIAVKCLLDSGNSGLSISTDLAARLGAPVVGNFQVLGLGAYGTQVVRAGPLIVGNATYPEAYYVTLSDISQHGYDIVLGADVFASTTLELDAKNHTVRFGAAPAAGGITLPISFENFVPVVNVGLGTVDARLAVDTGDESNINLSYDFYAKHPDLFTATQHRMVSGIGGQSIQVIGQIPQVTLGDYRTGPQTIGATRSLQGTAFGHLGAAFLQQFQVQMDYTAGELHLTPLP